MPHGAGVNTTVLYWLSFSKHGIFIGNFVFYLRVLPNPQKPTTHASTSLCQLVHLMFGSEYALQVGQAHNELFFQRKVKVESQTHIMILPVWLLTSVVLELIVEIEFDVFSYWE